MASSEECSLLEHSFADERSQERGFDKSEHFWGEKIDLVTAQFYLRSFRQNIALLDKLYEQLLTLYESGEDSTAEYENLLNIALQSTEKVMTTMDHLKSDGVDFVSHDLNLSPQQLESLNRKHRSKRLLILLKLSISKIVSSTKSFGEKVVFDKRYCADAYRLRNSIIRIQPHVEVLSSGRSATRIYLIGSRHFSSASADLVRDTISALKPDMLFLELCHERAAEVLSPDHDEDETFPLRNKWSEMLESNLLERIGETEDFLTLKIMTLFTEAMAKGSERLARKSRNRSGVGMRAGVEEVQNLEYPCPIILGDRPFEMTLSRLTSEIASLSFIQRLRLLCTVWQWAIECEDDGNDSEGRHYRNDRLRASFPQAWSEQMENSIPAYLLHYYASALSAGDETGGIRAIVAIVGEAHVEGIKKYWWSNEEQSLAEFQSIRSLIR